MWPGEQTRENVKFFSDVLQAVAIIFTIVWAGTTFRHQVATEGEEATGALPGQLRLWPTDARHLLAALPAGALDRLFLLFPDPWPKARHAKRRFVHPSLLPLVSRALRPGGEWRIASDDPTYQDWVAQVMQGAADFAPVARGTTRPADWPGTRYEAKALREGRTPIYWVFRRR